MAFALAPTNELLLHFKDDAGKHATMRFNILYTETDPASGAAAAISDAAAALSDSALYETEILIIAADTDPGIPTTGPYDRPSDKVQFRIKSEAGSFSTINIGAPLAGAFSNAWDVDFTAGIVTDFLDALFANANDAEGDPYVAVTSGHRRRPPRRKTQ